jgi:hypothetical protein
MRGTHLRRHFKGDTLAVHHAETQFVSRNATHNGSNLFKKRMAVEDFQNSFMHMRPALTFIVEFTHCCGYNAFINTSAVVPIAFMACWCKI